MNQDETRHRIINYLHGTLIDSQVSENTLNETRKKVHAWTLRTRKTRNIYRLIDIASIVGVAGFATSLGYGTWSIIDTLDFIASAVESEQFERKVFTTFTVVAPSTAAFAGILGGIVDTRRYLGLEKPSEDEVIAAKYKREDLATLVAKYKDGCGESGTRLAELVSNSYLFCKLANKVEIRTGILITSAEMSDTKGALAAAELAERLELADAEYTCLKIADRKGSFSAAKKLSEYLGGAQERDSSSVSGWLVAAAVLGFACT